ncbi:MAG: acetyl-CoA carboxylase biotin carboxylase subunit [Candidatus Rokubacteria bacterium]|nr:acetyl-CoA carboxylase biotin carboxylase subunit [Candidatus Rokubacteria bacterium]
MIGKVLVANRGEIAVRVIRACRELGLASVAVFSEADREALHVLMADEAYPIGPPPAAESYLRIDTLVAAAKAAGADAVHPGYGFLAENAAFAEACAAAGLVFVGPPPAAIRTMGDKTAARRIARELGVPMVPGTVEPLAADDDGRAAARAIGYPLMIKAALGGGGKGMRLVREERELPAALRMARGEAAGAFGDASVYVERYVPEPRHIEVQVLADSHGHVIHLGERECSIQRRHQKLVEECPSPLVDATMRERMGEAACRLARAAGYVNAGTVEFLVDSDRGFYFLEMNTRLQVEHPVTEMVTGIDLVREQLRLAAGEPLGYAQADVAWRGAAIECRINAEDPLGGWLPSPGTITGLRAAAGPWVRDDSGVYEGCTVPRFYDTLLAKLIVWGADRPTAIARMARALAEYKVVGVRTTIPVLAHVVAHEDFRAARLSTHFLERTLPDLALAKGRRRPVAIIAAVLAEYERLGRRPLPEPPSDAAGAWRSGLRPGWRGGLAK